MPQTLWVCLVILIVLIDFLQAHGPNVCNKPEMVTYTRSVYKSKSVPYQKHSFWSGWQTKYRTEYSYQDEVAYRFEPKYSCCSGYEGSIYDCKPSCKNKCPVNGFCVAPDQCSCNGGYGGSDCQPICESPCGKNEFCERPGECSCQSGYHRSSAHENCLPVCADGCGDHGFCSEPGKCECQPSYEKLENGTDCLPVCDPKCGQNSYCQEPQLCTCLEGYKADEQGTCSPICQEDCGPNSRCSKPGFCECEQGYAGDERGANCQPVCASCPENAKCLSPSNCICNPGYVMKDNRCEPHCEEDCSDYGHCVAPNQCECYEGHEETGEDRKCAPKCSKGCPNGVCYSPEMCVCNPGYLMGPNSVCEPRCSLNCVHGKCTQPDTCSCDPGYRFEENSTHVCQAICDSGCKNGDCMAPNICICHVGYQPNDTNPATSVCKPQCAEGCEFGDCVAPQECLCWRGYEKINGVCKPQTTTSTSTSTTEAAKTSSESDALIANDDQQQRTTPKTEVTSSTEVLRVHHSNCTGGCYCWIEYDEEGTFNTAKCAKICVDPQDQPCLNLDNCHCDPPSGQLVCKEDSSEDGSSEESHFVCKIQQQGKKARSEAEVRVPENSTASSTKWMVIMGSFAGIILGAALAVVAAKYYRRSTSRRDYEADERIYETEFE
ncbi:tenascin isoform X2 [Drosophila takahashii]|uniref:tenascin isoform X2 n=1 Tax=Drosophila takahashii TaxID=29030 RepID=UPI003899203F